MGYTPDESVPDSMYTNATEEKLCVCADSNGLSIELVDTEPPNEYWLYAGVTDWTQDKIAEWVRDLLKSGKGRDFGMNTLPQGPVCVWIYEEKVDWDER